MLMSFQAFIYVYSSRPLLNRGEWKNITHEVNIDRWDTVAMVINDNDFDKKLIDLYKHIAST